MKEIGKIETIISKAFLVFLFLGWSAQAQLFENEYHYEDLKKLIQSHSEAKNIDELLPVFRKNFPLNLRSRYLLVHHSHSLQEASPEYPRMILFSDDAKFILALTGSPDFIGSQDLEVIEYNNASESFDFYRIGFEKGRANFYDGVDHPKPTSCRNCHGRFLRPNWNPYALWPEAYGGNDDRFSPGSQEEQMFRNFLKGNGQSGRYQLLEGLPGLPQENKDEKIAISNNLEIYSHINSDRGQWFRTKDFDASYKSYPRANYKFTQEVARLTIRQAAFRLLNNPLFPLIKKAVAASLLVCSENPASFIPKELQIHPNLVLEGYLKDTKEQLDLFYKEITAQEQKVLGPNFGTANIFMNEDLGQFARLQFIFELIGQPIQAKDFSTTHSFNGYSFSHGNSGLFWLYEALQHLSQNALPMNCAELAKPE